MAAEHTLNKNLQQQRSTNIIFSGTGTASRAAISTSLSSSTEAGSNNEPTGILGHENALDLRNEINNLMVQKQERAISPEATSATQAKPFQMAHTLHSAGEHLPKLEEAIKKSIERKAETPDEERFQRTISIWEKPIKVSEQDEEWVKNEILQTAKEYVPWAVI
ncbi:hypothetical protein CPB97_006856 [Podila verticillata]|nr:hypothetical protein CPB97_006856 [Podila verticillata]